MRHGRRWVSTGRLRRLAFLLMLPWAFCLMGAQLWTPASPGAPALDLWFDGADSSSLTLNSGNSSQVLNWHDKSGNNRDATADPSYAPSLTTLNGKSALDFGPFLFGTTNPHMFFPVVQAQTVFKVWGSAQGGSFFMTNRYNYSWHRSVRLPPETNPANPLFEVDNNYSEPAVRSGDAITRLNGAVVDPSTAGLSGDWDIVDNRVASGSSFPTDTLAMDRTYRTGGEGIAEVIVVTGRPGEFEVQRIEGYLAWKWGLQGKLPSNHPFKTQPPMFVGGILNGGFEAGTTPDYTYGPTDQGPWVFGTGAGVTRSGTAFTYRNSAVPEGSIAAFVQSLTNVSQTFNLTDAGSYALYFRVVNRGALGYDSMAVTVDGITVFAQPLPVNPVPTVWMYAATPAITLSAGSHTVSFAGTTGNSDSTFFLDAVHLEPATTFASSRVRGSFEEWQIGAQNYHDQPGAQPWVFSNGGLAANGSTLGNPSAPDGAQVAFLRAGGTTDFTWTDPGGTYAMTFSAAASPNTSAPTLTLSIDGAASGSWPLTNTGSFVNLAANVTIPAGQHTLRFSSSGGTAFVDGVSQTAPAATLIADYRFEQTSWNGTAGEVQDSSGNGLHGKATGSPLPSMDTTSPAVAGNPGTCGYAVLPGPIGNGGAFQFDGLPVSTTDGNKTSVAFWMYWDGRDDAIPVGWAHYGLWLRNGLFGFNTYNNDVRGISSSGLANGWHHIAAVFVNANPDANELYVDGVLQTLSQVSGGPNLGNAYASSTLRFAAGGQDNSHNFSGLLDDLRVYNNGLKAGDVAAAMAAAHPCGAPSQALLAELRLDEGSWNGSTGEVLDSSGAGHPGTAVGPTLPSAANASPARPGSVGTCGYGQFPRSGAINVPNLPVSTASGDKTSVSFWMYWDGTDDVMPIGWNSQDLWFRGGWFGFNSSNSDIYGIASSALANGWHHVTAIFVNNDIPSAQLYIDGVSQALSQRLGSPSASLSVVASALEIGGWTSYAGFRFSGYLDEVRIYNGALTAAQVSAAMNAGHACPTAVVVPGAFNAFESATAAGAINGVIHTKVSGNAFSVDVVALDSMRSNVLTSFTGAVKVEVLDAGDNRGALDANACRSSWAPVASGAAVTVTFAGADAGRKTVSLTEPNAWRDARLRITTPATGTPTAQSCSSDDFAIRPASFANLSVSDADAGTAGTARSLANIGVAGGAVHKAGQPFTVQASAVNSAGVVTANYAGTPTPSTSSCAGPACLGGGVLSLIPSAVGGVINRTGSYGEVGAFSLQLIDSSFASVDANDGSSVSEMNIVSAVVDVGRFVPDHFDLQLLAAPVLRTFGSASCPARSFTYIGQPFGYAAVPQARVLARNAAGATTAGYAGALWKLGAGSLTQGFAPTPSTPALVTSAMTLPALTSNGDGTGLLVGSSTDALSFTRGDTPVAPFNASIALTWSAQDASEAGVAGNGSISTTTPLVFGSIAFDAGSQMRFGMLRMVPAYGSELIDLPVLLEAQYWDGQRMATNAADQCTSVPASAVAMSNYQRSLAACKTALGTGSTAMANGRGYLKLARPGSGNNGSVDLALQLGSSATGQMCATVNGAAISASAANLGWLQGRSGSLTTFDQNPSTRASFGQYRSPLIYMRESY